MLAFTAGVLLLVGINAIAPRLDPYFLLLIISIAINAILAVSLNLISGFTGQLNLGHAGFMAVGAYFSAALTYYFGGAAQAALGRIGVPGWLAANSIFLGALLLGGGLAALFGVLVGLPTLRLRGDYLAIATLGFGEIIRIIIVQLEVVGAARGFYGIPQRTTFLWAYGWAALTIIAVRNLMGSAHGRALASVREDEMAAQVMGIDTVRYKVRAFSIGAFFAGVAGGLFGHYFMLLNPSTFSFLRSIEILLMVVLGGMGSIAGSVAGAAIITVLLEALRTLAGVLAVIYCTAWTALLLPYLRAGTAAGSGSSAARRLGVGAILLGVAAVFAALMSRAELGKEMGFTLVPWLGLGAGGLGIAAIVSGEHGAPAAPSDANLRRVVTRIAMGAAAGAVFCSVFLAPGMLPPAVAGARDWLGQNVTQLRMVIYSGLLIALMLVRPQGIFGGAELTWRALRSILPMARQRATA
jgi:branched-chain amino acid transport system permease protein